MADDRNDPTALAGSPSVSIGLPVYNGAHHLDSALRTLLKQTFDDFELIISDNASTDNTSQICADFASRDARVRYVRAPVNRGASWNFNHVVELARAPLFAWAAHDDEWHPRFLELCIGVLNEREDVVACYGLHQMVHDDGSPYGPPAGNSYCEESRRDRWNHVLRDWQVHAAIYALMRTQVVKRTRGYLAHLSSDLVFMAEMLLHGKLIIVPEVLHRKRLPPGRTHRTREEILVSLSATRRRTGFLHRYGVLREELSGLRHAQLPSDERRTLEMDAWKHYFRSRSWLYDVIGGAKNILRAS